MSQAAFALRARNPDVLTCIANLSNDEVFTPPEFANQMLNTLEAAWAGSNGGASIWSDPTVTFLDPFTKSGVFLREITSRLTDGLASAIPDLGQRVDHILTKQVFGIGITQLTSMLARRSLYCSKLANGKHSVAKSFTTEDGNIWFDRTEHSWTGRMTERRAHPTENRGITVEIEGTGRCKFCGATEGEYARGGELETHAYAFIHTTDIEARMAQFFGADMHFDVIIGNPPYQLSDGGFGTSAAPIYQLFVEQAKKLDPRFLTMIVPARWFSGGKGLDEFRQSMLGDARLRVIDDYLSAADVFPGVGLKGGLCVFLWDRDNPGEAQVTTHFKDWPAPTVSRPLLEPGADTFIRFNDGLSILKKVAAVEGAQFGSVAIPPAKRFDKLVSARKPFGFETTFKGKATQAVDDVLVYQNGGKGYVGRDQVRLGGDLIDFWKVYTGRAAPGTGNRDTYPHKIISTPFIGEPGSVSSETYLCIGPLPSQSEAQSVLSYLSCRLTRLLILLHKPSQDTTRKVYTFVPTQDWSHTWTDDALYEKYGLSEEEIEFVESIVRPMDLNDESGDLTDEGSDD
jgi:hypothetical protein